jgi:hypothetical protein
VDALQLGTVSLQLLAVPGCGCQSRSNVKLQPRRSSSSAGAEAKEGIGLLALKYSAKLPAKVLIGITTATTTAVNERSS